MKRLNIRGVTLATALMVLALTSLPTRALADCNQARGLSEQSFRMVDYAEKINLLEMASELCPTNVLIWNNLGTAYEHKYRMGKAKQAYLRALVIDPDFAAAQAGLGDVAMHEGRFKEAEEYYTRFLKGVDKAISQGDPLKLAAHRDDYRQKLEDARFRRETQDKSITGLVPKSLIIQGLKPPKAIQFRPGPKPPAPAPARMAVNNVLFAYNSAELAEGSKPQLKEIAAALQSDQLNSQRFIIAGHTDRFGTETFNNTLSLKRAESVRGFMIAQGVDPNRLQIKGYGKSRLIILAGNKDQQALNRRVELVNAR